VRDKHEKFFFFFDIGRRLISLKISEAPQNTQKKQLGLQLANLTAIYLSSQFNFMDGIPAFSYGRRVLEAALNKTEKIGKFL
jgi:hypothetical protein